MLLSRLTLCAGALLVTACASAPPVGEHSPPAGQWPAVVAGPGAVEVSALAFVSGGIVMAGRSVQGVTVAEQNVAVAPGPFLVALNEVGVPAWARTFETTGTATIEAIVVAPGPALLFVGSFEGEIVSDEHRLSSEGRDCMIGRVQLDESPGAVSWLRALGGAGQETCRGLALATDGSVWVTGSYDQRFHDLPDPKGMSDVMVLQIDESTGEPKSTFAFGSPGDDQGYHITAFGDRGILVSGNFGGAAATGSTLELSEELRLVSAGDYDGFVAWFDRDGTPLGATAVSSPGFDVVTHAISHHDGWLIAGAQQQGDEVKLQGFVARLDADGHLAWTWSDPLMAAVTQLDILRDRIAALGHHRDGFQIERGRWRVVGETGITLVLLNDAGQIVGGYGCDSPGDDQGVGLATTPDGRVALAGNTSPGGGCVRLPGATPGGFVRLMVLDAHGELRPLVVEH